MKFNEEKKQEIVIYMLEKIEQNCDALSKVVSENFAVNQNTVHTYINELVDNNIIRRVKRGKYELVTNRYEFKFKRSKGDLEDDTYPYDVALSEHIESLGENIVSIWSYAFCEMVNNVIDHSNAENMKVIVEQNYLKTIAILLDDGVGIFKKIKDHFGYRTLDEAITELFKGKLTTDSENHSGEGIFFSSKLMDDFYIVSGGKVFSNNKYDDSSLVNIEDGELKGTAVFMSLSNFSHKKAKEVFDLYANVEGGFTKTQIPLSNIFDGSPVSRSQAKRVCSRLEEFKEVILDFAGISWMGQGFAHQMFVVFAKGHPEVSLVPINMNEDVKKMYVHVTYQKDTDQS